MSAPVINPLMYAQSKSLASLLKKRFPNLTTDETLALVFDILVALEKVKEQQHE